jgi:O-antigen biosynthesis protein
MKINPLEHPICLSRPLRVVLPFPWLEHTPFAMFLVDILQPGLFVELGTHTGVSYCAFCQAVKELNLDTKCYAIDNWKGDSQAGFYDAKILEELTAYHDPLYSSFSRLVQSDFDDAVNQFKDKSIDLLHIDGYHTYEAVRHDFETWKRKVSDNGVVLFHDINVKLPEYGVWKFWEEIKKEYVHIEMLHCNGLGLISLSQQRNDQLGILIHTNGSEQRVIKEFFQTLGSRLVQEASLKEQKEQSAKLSEQLTIQLNYDKDLQNYMQGMTQLNTNLSEEIKNLQNHIQGLSQLNLKLSEELSSQMSANNNFSSLLREQNLQNAGLAEQVNLQANRLNLQTKQLEELLSQHSKLTEQFNQQTILISDLSLQLQEQKNINQRLQGDLDGIIKSKAYAVGLFFRKIRLIFPHKSSPAK